MSSEDEYPIAVRWNDLCYVCMTNASSDAGSRPESQAYERSEVACGVGLPGKIEALFNAETYLANIARAGVGSIGCRGE